MKRTFSAAATGAASWRRPAAVRAELVFVVILISWLGGGCERAGRVSESTRRSLADSAAEAPSWTFLTYSHAGRTDTLRAGATGGLVDDATDVYLDVGGQTDEASLRAHLQVEPAGALEGEVRWSGYRSKALFRLHRLAPGHEVFITLRAGLPREGDQPLPDDQVWWIRREVGTTVRISASGPGVLAYEDGRYSQAAGPAESAEPTLFVPSDTAVLELHFSAPMDRGAVEQRLRAELTEASSIELAWTGSERLGVTLVFPEPVGSTAPGWDSHYLELGGLQDSRSLPTIDPRVLLFEVGRPTRFQRWSEATGVERLAVAPPRLLPLTHRGTVSQAGLLLWHFEEAIGDYWGVSPWLVDPETGEYRRIGSSQAAHEALSMEWIPIADAAAVGNAAAVQVVRRDVSDGSLSSIQLSLGDSVNVLQFTVAPTDGRLAVITLPQMYSGEEIPASVVVLSPEGEGLNRTAEIGRMDFPESSPESLWPMWLPDGRLAFLRRPFGLWSEEEVPTSKIAFVDFTLGEVVATDVIASAIWDADTDGRLLIDGNRLYDPASEELRTLTVRGGAVDLIAFSPGSEWIAGSSEASNEVGVYRQSDASWQVLGRGSLIGWSPDGSLYWLGLDDED